MTAAAPSGWLSYDSVAATYERVAEPWFAALAGDLVAAVAPRRGERILDLGTGTGLALRAALRACPTARGFGVDPSVGMLARHDRGPPVGLVAGMAPGLPFALRSFDVVLANLSVSHMPEPDAGVGDAARLLVAGGRFGCTAWSITPDDRPGCPRGDANRILEQVRAELGLDMVPPTSAAPWEDSLRDPDRLHGLLTDAGLADVLVREHRSSWTFTIDEFLSGWGSDGRYRRHAAGAARWNEYVDTAARALRAELGERVEVTNLAWVAVGRLAA